MSLALAGSAAAEDIIVVSPIRPPQAPAATPNFTGRVQVQRLFGAVEPSRVTGGLVIFEAGARTHWHTHALGQTLIVTAGVGRVQQWGGPIQEIKPGDTVRIPANVKHWHGASPNSSMSHVAIGEQLDGKSVEWLEKVDDAQFNVALPNQSAPTASAGPSRARQLVGSVAPKLAQLTDDVLFGDVWARPQLSKRDRSIATVSALITMNRPEQLRSHLALAKQNGATEEELSEVITHLAFYAGWPSAMSAAGVAKEVFQQP
ncbi:(R)-mandelonitrile lyase [Oleiharenicola lentus]|uniref:(R)-mandelonitrile lyase n=1 Tax=Oleiharenicola lentus TaxID=2508720 RepID=UPI003F669FB6